MKKIIVSGFGGQGVLSLGLFVAYSAMHMDKNVSWLPSYGPEMRGGTANCSVTVSEEEIACPIISHPDVLVAMNAPSIDKFADSVVPGGVILVNASATDKLVGRTDVTALYVPVDELAAAVNPKGGNIVMLGAMLGHLSLSKEAAEKAIEEVFKEKPKFIDANLACLAAGIRHGQARV